VIDTTGGAMKNQSQTPKSLTHREKAPFGANLPQLIDLLIFINLITYSKSAKKTVVHKLLKD
jgi:hypothetical protein